MCAYISDCENEHVIMVGCDCVEIDVFVSV